MKHKAFIEHVATLNVNLDNKVHFLKKTQIAHLIADEAPTKVPSKYANFADVFSPKLAAKLFEYTIINNYAIKLVDN